MPDQDERARLKELEARIARAKGREPAPKTEEHYSQASIAWRMVTELVAGIGIGFVLGLGLDALLGTRPWLMVVFLFFGLAAGIKTMLRTANEVAARQQAEGDESGGRRGD